jgi:hypothetical protein
VPSLPFDVSSSSPTPPHHASIFLLLLLWFLVCCGFCGVFGENRLSGLQFNPGWPARHRTFVTEGRYRCADAERWNGEWRMEMMNDDVYYLEVLGN